MDGVPAGRHDGLIERESVEPVGMEQNAGAHELAYAAASVAIHVVLRGSAKRPHRAR
jgi:hypothetical protein